MKSNGSVYVSVVIAALLAYFSYQWWFNPHRVVKRRLGELAVVLSAPAREDELARVARLARLRGYFADGVRVRVGGPPPRELVSRDDVLAAIAAWRPEGGSSVDFVDVDVNVMSDSAARAYLTAEVTTRDVGNGAQTLDAREATLSIVRADGEWLVSEAEVKALPGSR